MPRSKTEAEESIDADLVQIVRNLAIAHAREDYRRATGQLEVIPEKDGDRSGRSRRSNKRPAIKSCE